MTLDPQAMRSISYGLYVLTSADSEERVGCIINAVAQVTSRPLQISIAVNHDNHTADVIKRSNKFCLSILDETAEMPLIGNFGFRTSHNYNKFENFSDAIAITAEGIPYVTKNTCAMIACQVDQMINLGTHQMFIGHVVESAVLSAERPLTYAYYHEVLKGKTPPKAASFVPGVDDAAPQVSANQTQTKKQKFKCELCGYVVEAEGDELPDDYRCPMCGASKERFVKIS